MPESMTADRSRLLLEQLVKQWRSEGFDSARYADQLAAQLAVPPGPDPPTREAVVDAIIASIGANYPRFRTFGGGRDSDSNPMAHALRNEPLSFAASVDVRAVVEFVYDALAALAGRSIPHEPT